MKKIVVTFLLVPCVIFFCCSALLFIPQVQTGCQRFIEQKIENNSNYSVRIGSLYSVFPLYFKLSNLKVYEKGQDQSPLAEISTIEAVPALFDLLMRKISFVYLACKDVTLTLPETKASDNFSLINFLPKRSCKLYWLSLENVQIKNSTLIPFSLKGNFSWQRNEPKLRFDMTAITKNTRNKVSATITTEQAIIKTATTVTPHNSYYDLLEVKTALSSHNSGMLQALFSPTPTAIPEASTYLEGTVWSTVTINKNTQENVVCNFSWAGKELTFNAEHSTSLAAKLATQYTGKIWKDRDDFHLELASDKLNYGSVNCRTCKIELDCTPQKDLFLGDLHISCLFGDYPFHGTSRFRCDPKQGIAFDMCTFTLEENIAEGNFEVLFQPFLVKGKFDGHAKDLSSLLYLAKIQGSGSAKFSIDCHEQVIDGDPRQTCSIDTHITKLRTPQLSADSIACLLESTGDFLSPQMNMSAKLIKAHIAHCSLKEAQIHTKLDTSDEKLPLTFSIQSTGNFDRDQFALDLQGYSDIHTLRFDTFQLNSTPWNIVLSKPCAITYAPHRFTIDSLELRSGTDGLFSCTADCVQEKVQGAFLVKDFPVDFIRFLSPQYNITGRVWGEGTIQGTLQEPFLHANLATSSLQVVNDRPELLPPLHGNISCDLNSTALQVIAEIEAEKRGANTTPLVIDIRFPMLSLPGEMLTFDPFNLIQGTIKGSCEVSPFFAPFLLDDELVEGEIQANITVSGTIERPSFEGTLQYEHGKIDILKTGQVFADMTMSAHLKNNFLFIDSCTATDEQTGQYKAHGKIQLSSIHDFPYSFTIEGTNTEVIHCDLANAYGTGQIELSGNFKEALLKGSVTANKIDIFLNSNLAERLPTLEYILINEDPLVTKDHTEQFVLSFDLDVAIPTPCMITGRGLDSQWTGGGKVTGTADNLLIKGQLVAKGGSFTFANKTFALKNGTIDFAGDIRTASRLQIAAAQNFGPIHVDLFLRGSLDAIRLSFESAPPLSQKEILSWILFNKPLSDISPMESLQLAQILLSMNGENSRFNFLDKLKKSLGIDQIDITREEQLPGSKEKAHFNVAIAKYLSKNVLLRLSQDVTNAVNRVAIEARITKDISVKAEIGDNQEGQVSLLWQHDY